VEDCIQQYTRKRRATWEIVRGSSAQGEARRGGVSVTPEKISWAEEERYVPMRRWLFLEVGS